MKSVAILSFVVCVSTVVIGVLMLFLICKDNIRKVYELQIENLKLDRDRYGCVEARQREEEQNLALVSATVFQEPGWDLFRWRLGSFEGLEESREDAERAVRALVEKGQVQEPTPC